jgi:hypothetical protein
MIFPLCFRLCRLGRHANMENTDFDWLNGNWAPNLEFSTFDSPRAGTTAEQASPVAQPASQAAERVDEPVAIMYYRFSDLVVGMLTSNMTRITLYVSTMTFGGRSPSVKTSEPGMLVQIQIPISS